MTSVAVLEHHGGIPSGEGIISESGEQITDESGSDNVVTE